MRTLLRIVALFLPIVTLAQQDAQFSQYMMNPFIWNPSFPSVKSQHILSFHHRSQWVGYATSNTNDNISPPSTQLFTAIAPLNKINSGLGICILNDNIGPLRNQSAVFSYSYGLKLASGKLGFGAGVGVQSMQLNTSMWRPENSEDPSLYALNTGNINQLKPNFRFGTAFSNDKIYIGLSTNNTFEPTYTFSNGKVSSSLKRHFYLQGAYHFFISDKVTLQPCAILKSVSGISSVEVSGLVLLQNIWLGLSYRTSDAATFLAGINVLPDKSLKIGYNLDLSVINTTAKSLTSHEIFMSYNISSFLDNRKPIVRSPRFRF